MTASGKVGLLLTFAGGWFGFANPIAHIPPLALLLPAGITLLAWSLPSARSAFKHVWFAASATFAASLYWVSFPVYDYAFQNWALALPCPILVGMYLGLYPAMYGAALRLVKGRLHGVMLPLFAATLWWALDIIRGFLFTGFPWNTLASAVTPMPEAIQLASIIGAGGVTALLVLASATFALSKGNARPILWGVLLLVGIWAHGHYSLNKAADAFERTIGVALVQGNINQAQKWSKSYRQGTIDRYKTLTEGAVSRGQTDLVIWPETALPFYMQKIDSLSLQVRKLSKKHDTPILTGSPAYTLNHQKRKIDLHNRAYLVAPQGPINQYYDKEHLVPFGEYVPLKQIFFFVEKLVEGAGDFVPGKQQPPITTGDARLGVLICYEAIFPELAQNRVESGANVLVNISNDAWFGQSSAPAQHLSNSILRAVEQNRTILRGTNTGYSAVISPRGEILTQGDLFKAEAIRYDQAPLLSHTTFFHRHYSTIQILPFVLLGFCSLAALLSRRPL